MKMVKKIFKVIKSILTLIFGIAFFGFVILMTTLLLTHNDFGISQFGNTSVVIIKQAVSSTRYKKGDLLLIEGKKLELIKPGDEIFMYQVREGEAINLDVGQVESTDITENTVKFKNGSTYDGKFIIGETSKVYNSIGTYLSVIQSKWGFLFIVLVPCFLVFVYEVYALVMAIKYGDEEDED